MGVKGQTRPYVLRGGMFCHGRHHEVEPPRPVDGVAQCMIAPYPGGKAVPFDSVDTLRVILTQAVLAGYLARDQIEPLISFYGTDAGPKEFANGRARREREHSRISPIRDSPNTGCQHKETKK